ncbi:hypothetical protein GLYMA_08G052200v4 [Glycine max]|uniref:Uncharacterized protein n=1 Tax=Glycine max TaxID=3847 RepID=A0A0R0IH91_SOYBN|nr:hypothetical protein GYH30_020307 [Glycine max]KRH41799.1 hypothetical protein GLYMA_08G052200v4 [Glycine max]
MDLQNIAVMLKLQRMSREILQKSKDTGVLWKIDLRLSQPENFKTLYVVFFVDYFKSFKSCIE